jgi:filamentous hemagglutinin
MAKKANVTRRNSPTRPRLKPLAASIRVLVAGGTVWSAWPAQAELPVAANVWASMGNATRQVVGNTMTINQQTDRAVLNWNSFNISEDSAVRFNQPASTSIALNRIYQNDPSRILGELTANGHIYLVNQNGFVFGRNSKVDANTLVATTLNITDEVLERGITKVIDQNGSAALTGSGQVYRLNEKGQPEKIKVEIESGAQIKTNSPNGRILIFAPSIENSGSVRADDGQVIMAAATDKVYLQEDKSDSSTGHLLVEVNTGGDVRNIGQIVAKRGNITLMGFAVNQEGLVSASTSVKVNGTVRLLAREKGGQPVRLDTAGYVLEANRTGRPNALNDGLDTVAKVTLGPNSLTEVTLDPQDGMAKDSAKQPQSRVEIMGRQVRLRENARIVAPHGEVDIAATAAPQNRQMNAPSYADTFSENNPVDDAQVIMESGSSIDVSGVKHVPLPMESNVVDVELRSDQLRDAPLLKDSILFGKTVRVDARKGTPIADISGALALIERGIDERSTEGGEVNIYSAGDVVVAPGARIDVSGGSVQYQDGYLSTTHLVQNERLVEISDANPNIRPTRIFGTVEKVYTRWGVKKVWDIPGPFLPGRFEPGYVDGRAAGPLNIGANRVFFAGELLARTEEGRYQRRIDERPDGGRLFIDLARFVNSPQKILFQNQNLPGVLASISRFIEDADGSGDAIAEEQPAVISTDMLEAGGVRHVSVETNNAIDIPETAAVNLPDGGSLALKGGQVDVSGKIDIAGGTVDVSSVFQQRLVDLKGDIRLAGGAEIDVSGRWVNDLPLDRSAAFATGPVTVDGGTVRIKSEGNLTLDPDSAILADGGAWVDRDGNLVSGSGGEISLEAAGPDGSNLILGDEQGRPTLRAFGLDEGGVLSLTSNEAVVAASAPFRSPSDPLRPLWLPPAFFREGGFGRYEIRSNQNGVTVAEGTEIDLIGKTLLLKEDFANQSAARRLVSAGVATEETLPDFQRRPTDLILALAQSLNQLGRPGASVTVGRGGRIVADPGAEIVLSSDSSVFFDGGITIPGGHVSLVSSLPVETKRIDSAFLPNKGVFLGADSTISTAGKTLYTPNRLGWREGRLISGGTVDLRAERGFVVMQKSSVVDVTGGTGVFDVPQATESGLGFTLVEMPAAANSGFVNITASEGFAVDGTLKAAPAGAGAAGGTLSLTLDTELRKDSRSDGEIIGMQLTPYPRDPRVIEVRGGAAALPSDWKPGDDIPADMRSEGRIAADTIQESGFAGIALRASTELTQSPIPKDEIRFRGDVSLAARREIVLDAPVLSWAPQSTADGANVSLSASYLALGSSFSKDPRWQSLAEPSPGPAAFNASGSLVDLVGGTVTKGFGNINLNSDGDIRLRGVRRLVEIKDETGQVVDRIRDFHGEFDTAANVSMAAAQIYPTTASTFRLAITGNPEGTLTTRSRGESSPVLSAGGKVILDVPNFVHHGALKAPFGGIEVNSANGIILAPGSLLSVSGEGMTVPFGRLQGGQNWLYPWGGDFKLVFDDAPPDKVITLDGRTVEIAAGSVVDVSGGGDLYAFEFVPGPGGSSDYLDPLDPRVLSGEIDYQEKFAILPGLTGRYAPYDHNEFPASGLKAGDNIYLAGYGDLPEGEYTLLPAHYALLPGAYLVTAEPDNSGISAGEVRRRDDGVPIVAGYRGVAGTGIRDAVWSGFAIESGAAARLRSEYNETLASDFYRTRAATRETALPLLPGDAGQLSVAVQDRLVIEGALKAAADGGGRGGRLDIAADNLAIVPRRSDGATGSVVEIAADELSRFGAESILLGGFRRAQGGGFALDVKAGTVTVENGATLQGDDVILAAKEGVTVKSGGSVSSTGRSERAEAGLSVTGDSAVVRVSAGRQGGIARDGVAGASGFVALEGGALLRAEGSMLIDATKNTVGTSDNRLDGELQIDGGSLYLGADAISLGNAPGGTGGFLLSQDRLNAMRPEELILSSRSDVKVFGSVLVDTGALDVRGAGLTGFGAAGDRAVVRANRVSFSNPNGVEFDTAGTGTGLLTVESETISLGIGAFAFEGFASSSWSASGSLIGAGRGDFRFDGDLNISAPVISALSGTNTQLHVPDHRLIFTSPDSTSVASESGFGARWLAEADFVEFGGGIVMPGGTFELSGRTGVVLDPTARIDVSGVALDFPGVSDAFVPGGSVRLSSTEGFVSVSPGSTVDFSGAAGGGDAGSLSVKAPRGDVALGGSLSGGAAAGYVPGSIELAGLTFSQGLSLSGSFGAVDVRAGSGDLNVSRIVANVIELSADQGSVMLSGTLDASGRKGGRVLLAAGHDVHLLGGSAILARAAGAGEKGGRVILSTTDTDGDGLGRIRVDDGSFIDVSGAEGGEVTLRALQLDNNVDGAGDEVAVDPVGGTVVGAAVKQVEGVLVRQVGDGEIDNADISAWAASTAAFMSHAVDIAARVGGGFDVVPGLDVTSSGDLALNTIWDFRNPAIWSYTGTPGSLTIRSEGDLTFGKSLTDGFAKGPIPGTSKQVNDLLQAGPSWSYRLIAGADVSAADFNKVMVVKKVVANVEESVGNFTVEADAKVRTGTGDIDIRAGGNLTLDGDTAAIYTAGRPEDKDRYGKFPAILIATNFYGEYPVDGGDISIQVEGDIKGAPTKQLFDWLVRTGNWQVQNDTARPTAWAVAITDPINSDVFRIPADASGFRQNVGALGGGDVDIRAGGKISDLSVVIPTTGKQVGKVERLGRGGVPVFGSNEVDVRGGGDLSVKAGGDLLGGVFYVAKGEGEITAGGRIAGGEKYTSGPLFALGDARLDVQAGGDIEVGAVFNPTLLKERVITDSKGGSDTFFSTYSENSGITLTSLGGSVKLANDSDVVNSVYTTYEPTPKAFLTPDQQHALTVYPGSLSVRAWSGDIEIERPFVLFPQRLGTFELLAGNDIRSGSLKGGRLDVGQSDADPDLLPSAAMPTDKYQSDILPLLNLTGNAHAPTPVHKDDPEPARIVAKEGDIVSSEGNPLFFHSPKPVYVEAGRDIRDVSFVIQNLRPNDVSVIKAGRDFRLLTDFIDRTTGALIPTIDNILKIAGPGNLYLLTGRDIDLGAAVGIETVGNRENPALPKAGTSLTLMAGLKEQPNYAGFTERYLAQSTDYRQELKRFMAARGFDVSGDDDSVLAAFRGMSLDHQLALLLDIYFTELRESGDAAAKAKAGGEADWERFYARGFDAIETLFSGKYQGDIKLFFSKIHTRAPADIRMLTPGGLINLGLSVKVAGQKSTDQLGVVTLQGGAIDMFADGDIQVNQSRAATLNGGDLTGWSSNGDIDAGAGSKADFAASKPKYKYDENGNRIPDEDPEISGNGIFTDAPSGVVGGAIHLATPRGVINAGEAGIRSAGDLTLAANAVIGADNISAGGQATGVPTAPAVVTPDLGAASAAAGVSKTAEQSTESMSDKDKDKTAQNAGNQSVNLLSVDVLGFGNCSVGDVRDGKAGCS